MAYTQLTKGILALLLLPVLLHAQEPVEGEETEPSGQGMPTLEVPEEIVVYGKRGIVLPPARKGEVFDTALYVLPPGDTLIFGDRITNLEGDGGILPVYGEFNDPMVLNAEVSIGTYVSPRGRFGLEYAVDRWNVRGLLDVGSTAGHVDGAEASSLLLDAGIEYQIPGQLPSPGKARVHGGVTYLADSWTLYGNQIGQFDRSRSIFDLDLGISSETDASFDYALGLSIESVALEDDTLGFTGNTSALTPAFDAQFRLGDDALNLGAELRYQSTSLDYDTATDNPDFVEVSGQVEWSPSPGLFVTAGGVFAHGGYSDSGSTTLIMPRGAVRYDMNETFALFARFAPELRAPSVRSRIMSAPYVDREIQLRPEKVNVHAAAGTRINLGSLSVEGELFVETAKNTPVVTLDSVPGALRYAHLDSRTFGVRGNAKAQITTDIALTGELTVMNAVDDATDEQLPMRPNLELRGRADVVLTEKIGLYGTLLFQNEQNVTSDFSVLPTGVDRTLETRLLFGAGATYDVLDNVQVFADVTNLLAQGYDWWQNYEAPGLELRLGARARF